MQLTKELIYETVYQLVSDSTEWGVEEDNIRYGQFIDGAMTMATMLLDKIQPKDTRGDF